MIDKRNLTAKCSMDCSMKGLFGLASSKGAYLIHGFVVFLITIACIVVLQTFSQTNFFVVGRHGLGATVDRSAEPAVDSPAPDVIIFRRTRKTGSSSMLEQLLKVADQYNYTALYESGLHLRTLVRAENVAMVPQRIFVAEHNTISRADTGSRRVLIVDTIADGYKQITSFCRYVPKVRVRDCEQGLEDCLRGSVAQSENRYRWAGRDQEDSETYIDIPLSVEHPALSTRAFRRVFPEAVLDVRKLNVANSSCDESTRLRAIYSEIYKELDKQVEVLQNRLLILAGYPISKQDSSIKTSQLLDAAEKMERINFLKEGLSFGTYKSEKAVSADHLLLKKGQLQWVRLNDSLKLESARK